MEITKLIGEVDECAPSLIVLKSSLTTVYCLSALISVCWVATLIHNIRKARSNLLIIIMVMLIVVNISNCVF